jgi:hypothetical protein
MNYFIAVLSILFCSFSFGQRFSTIEKNTSNYFLFDEANPTSLISIAKQIAKNGCYNYDLTETSLTTNVCPEMLDFLMTSKARKYLTDRIGSSYFEVLPNHIGEDSTILSEEGFVETVFVLVEDHSYYDLNNISQLVLFEKLVKDSLTDKSSYQIDRIGFAKKYSEIGEKYFITFSMDYKDLMVANGVTLRISVPKELNDQLTDLINPKSFISKLKELQFQKMKLDSISLAMNGTFNNIENSNQIQFDWNFITKDVGLELPDSSFKTKVHYLSNFKFLPIVNLDGDDSTYVNSNGKEVIVGNYETIDSNIYWIDLENQTLELVYHIGDLSDTTGTKKGVIIYKNLVDIVSIINTNSTYTYSLGNIGEPLTSESNYNLIKDVFPYKSSTEFQHVSYLNNFLKSKHKYHSKNKEVTHWIKENYFVNTYFIAADPNFGEYLK